MNLPHTIKDEVHFIRGMGDSGWRIEIYEIKDLDITDDHGYEVVYCRCGYDRAKVETYVSPEHDDIREIECAACGATIEE
ncbi:hypothetical protein ACFQL7_20530 [Halocatena marina]|uniref:Uncharacterized protein n=1 Tax=Halocatena marina TaxID=2934937 RepID=A0ABD5YWK4_9EURY|nr:hypothetical protein [Halocatena marina]